jgi:hypothetical protein
VWFKPQRQVGATATAGFIVGEMLGVKVRWQAQLMPVERPAESLIGASLVVLPPVSPLHNFEPLG